MEIGMKFWDSFTGLRLRLLRISYKCETIKRFYTGLRFRILRISYNGETIDKVCDCCTVLIYYKAPILALSLEIV